MLRSIQYSRTANLRAAACCPTSLEFQKLASTTLTLPSSLAVATPPRPAAPRRSQRYFHEPMRSDDPGRAFVCDQQDDAQRNRGKTISAAQPQERAHDSANKNARAIDYPVGTEKRRDQRAQRCSQSCPRKALPGECQRINSGEQDHNCRNRRPIKFRQLQAAR